MVDWRHLPGYEGLYSVSDEGDVYSHRRNRVMSPSLNPRMGYKRVVLHDSKGEKSTRNVHSLVAECFLGPRQDGSVVCHRDGDGSSNQSSNLRYDTASGNMRDRRGHGTDHNVNREACPRGHPLRAPNLIEGKVKRGHRGCRACLQVRSDVYNHPHLDFRDQADKRYSALTHSGH